MQYAPVSRGLRLPSSLVSKSFTFSSGKLCLEVTLDKEIFYHGEGVGVNVVVSNNSRKSVRNIKVISIVLIFAYKAHVIKPRIKEFKIKIYRKNQRKKEIS